MTTMTRADFQHRFENRSIDLKKAESGLTTAQERALARADHNHDGKIEGAAEVNAAFTAMDDFDRNGSRNSVNLGTNARPMAMRSAMNTLEQASTAAPRRGLRGSGSDAASGNTRADSRGNRSGANGVAHIDRTLNAGARNQRVDGRITVNGHSYDFRSGGHGRGSLPKGTYDVTRHLDRRSNNSMQVGGEGYSFAVSDKYDARVGGTRSLLRIHPDGASPGTEGCIGIVGNAATQRQFRADMLAELRANGGHYSLRVE